MFSFSLSFSLLSRSSIDPLTWPNFLLSLIEIGGASKLLSELDRLDLSIVNKLDENTMYLWLDHFRYSKIAGQLDYACYWIPLYFYFL